MDSNLTFRPPQDLTFAPRLAGQLSQGTIRSVVDALVELITNSDDSYHALEEDGNPTAGSIQVLVVRSGTKCKYLEVRDHAAGMEMPQLEEALVFGGETSGFYKGRKVRGLFGRGLKESIIALGSGEIATVRDNKISVAKLYWDPSCRGSKVKFSNEPVTAGEIFRTEYGLLEGSGTVVRIQVLNDKIACPSMQTLKRQLENHYVLRDIMSSDRRSVELTLKHENGSGKGGKLSETQRLRFTPPSAVVVAEREIELHRFGDKIQIRVLESREGPLEQPKHNPYARAGLLIRTEGAILDNELFRFTYEDAARYFLGEVQCPGIAERVRAGDFGIIDQNRAGIEWNHDYCRAIQAEVERILEPLIQKKKRELNIGKQGEASSSAQRKVNRLCKILNQLAKQELEDDMETDHPGLLDIACLTLVPCVANVPPGGERVLTVYVPKRDVLSLLPDPIAQLTSDNDMVPFVREGADGTVSAVLETSLVLRAHPDYPETYCYGWVKVRGDLRGEQATVTCRLGNLPPATAVVSVAPPKRMGCRRRPPRKGGMFTDIKPDTRPQPYHRVLYEESSGVIYICVNFPGVSKILSPRLDEIEQPQGSMLCAELVLEAFCGVLARKNFRRSKAVITTLETAPEAVFKELQRLQREYGEAIYSAVVEKG